MVEYCTKPLSREVLLVELCRIEAIFSAAGAATVSLSFGWDSNLPIDQMWKEQEVPASSIRSTLIGAEQQGVFDLGKADVFLDGNSLVVQLCHEGDLHVKGEAAAVEPVLAKWKGSGYEPTLVGPAA